MAPNESVGRAEGGESSGLEPGWIGRAGLASSLQERVREGGREEDGGQMRAACNFRCGMEGQHTPLIRRGGGGPRQRKCVASDHRQACGEADPPHGDERTAPQSSGVCENPVRAHLAVHTHAPQLHSPHSSHSPQHQPQLISSSIC